MVNIQEAKTHLSRLLKQVQAGEDVVISKSGSPIAKLVPFRQEEMPRELGGWEGKVWVSDDFDEEDPDIINAFKG